MYEEQLKCADGGDGGFTTIEEFVRLEGKGAALCSSCGDVFPTHGPQDCPNYPYVLKGDQGFKATYNAQAVAMVEHLQVVLDRIEGEGTQMMHVPPARSQKIIMTGGAV